MTRTSLFLLPLLILVTKIVSYHSPPSWLLSGRARRSSNGLICRQSSLNPIPIFTTDSLPPDDLSLTVVTRPHSLTIPFDDSPHVSVHDTVQITYKPLPSAEFKGEDLSLIGGFNDWSADDDAPTITLPFAADPAADGSVYTATLTVPNFARTLTLYLTDGVRFSSPYGVHLKYIEVATMSESGESAEKITTCLQDPSGKITKIGDIPTVDPLELEKLVTSEQERRNVVKMETLSVDPNRGVETVLQVGADGMLERSTREFLAEADVVGRSLGMGNMEIGEARNAYMTVDPEGEGLEGVGGGMRALEEAGFGEVEEGQVGKLMGEGKVSIGDFVRIYNFLDDDQVGIDMV